MQSKKFIPNSSEVLYTADDFDIDDESNTSDDLDFLKYAKCPRQNEQIQFRLLETQKVRKDLLQQKPAVNIADWFPFFFIDPSLIIFDYSITFGKEIYSERFVEEFNKELRANAAKTLTYLGVEKVSFGEPEWPSSISSYLSLIKLLPTTLVSGNTFMKQVDCFIVLRTENVTEETITLSNYPLIVAVGPNRAAIEKYYLHFETKLIPIPLDWKFEQVADLLFKIHYSFNVNFNPLLEGFYNLLAYFVYNQHGVTVTPGVRKVYNYIAKNAFRNAFPLFSPRRAVSEVDDLPKFIDKIKII